MAGTIALPRLHRRSQTAWGIVAGLVVLAVVAAAISVWSWWYRGGGHLSGAAGGYASPVEVGEVRHFGIELQTHGGTVELVSAEPVHLDPADAAVGFSVVTHGQHVGGESGDLADMRFRRTAPLPGAHVRGTSPDDGLGIALTLSPLRRGVYELHDVDVTYRVGPRTRHTRVPIDVCLLAYSQGEKQAIVAELHRIATTNPFDEVSRIPLVGEYQRCSNPG